MATAIIFADATDNYVESVSAAYATVRSGDNLTVYDVFPETLEVGQRKQVVAKVDQFTCYESFLAFDSAGVIAAGDTVTGAVLSLVGLIEQSLIPYVIEARTYDWGAAVTTADWVAGADLGALPLMASYDTTGGFPLDAYMDFTSEAGFPAAVTKDGKTMILLCSARTTAGTEPTDDEELALCSADTIGTALDPKLTVTYTAASTGFAYSQVVTI